jgi:hypothetical protein
MSTSSPLSSRGFRPDRLELVVSSEQFRDNSGAAIAPRRHRSIKQGRSEMFGRRFTRFRERNGFLVRPVADL